jgi:hypothetical protein
VLPTINVKHDLAELSARLGLMQQERMAAAVRAANRTMTTVRKRAADDLKKEYPGLRVSQLKARMKLTRATRQTPVAAVTFSGRRIALFGNFGMRSVGRWGARFSKLPWRLETISGEPVTQEMLARAFRQRGPGGRASVFARHTKVRTSHEVLLAPGVARALVEQKIGDALVRFARDRFSVVFVQEAKFRLSKR